QSWNRHQTLKVDRISHQSLAVRNGLELPRVRNQALCSLCQMPVLPEQHQVLNQFEIPLVESEEDPASLQEIPPENFELWVRPQVASSQTSPPLPS
nr:hypothetical protein [Tanacetum cinerariifolium]